MNVLMWLWFRWDCLRYRCCAKHRLQMSGFDMGMYCVECNAERNDRRRKREESAHKRWGIREP